MRKLLLVLSAVIAALTVRDKRRYDTRWRQRIEGREEQRTAANIVLKIAEREEMYRRKNSS